jgi:hypothetical protein
LLTRRGAADRGEYRQPAGAVASNAGQVLMSAFGGKAEIVQVSLNVRHPLYGIKVPKGGRVKRTTLRGAVARNCTKERAGFTGSLC